MTAQLNINNECILLRSVTDSFFSDRSHKICLNFLETQKQQPSRFSVRYQSHSLLVLQFQLIGLNRIIIRFMHTIYKLHSRDHNVLRIETCVRVRNRFFTQWLWRILPNSNMFTANSKEQVSTVQIIIRNCTPSSEREFKKQFSLSEA